LIFAGPALRRKLAPTIAAAAALSLFHALTIVSARFHIPVEPLMAAWAGAGVASVRAPACFGAIRSASARHDVERVGVVGRLG
jgi:hypothetical protein